jgi:hypothetical protein
MPARSLKFYFGDHSPQEGGVIKEVRFTLKCYIKWQCVGSKTVTES